MSSHLILTGAAVGLKALEGLQFVADKNHCGCAICGKVFQSDLDRLDDPTLTQLMDAAAMRTVWRINHAKEHTEAEHRQLALSGLWCTPEAAQKLAPFGVIPLSDAVTSGETEHALRLAGRAPTDDADST